MSTLWVVTEAAGSIDRVVTGLLPSLSRSLAEFNVFRVMHHGTHEKQLSNVFAWLLKADGTHGLGDALQRIFVGLVNRSLPVESHLPASGYRVTQEVDTSGHADVGKDIADIVLTSPEACIVVENYESSDGHGHEYGRYRAYGAAGGKRSVVAVLCARRESHRLRDGWEQAAVVTYPDLLEELKAHIDGDRAWRRAHPRQVSFIHELVEHFTEGPRAMSNEDRIGFIRAMCDTGESARYGHRPQAAAAQEFADLVAQHAQRQFEDGRNALGEVKKALKRYAKSTVSGQLSAKLDVGQVTLVRTRFVGKWEWCVELERGDGQPTVSFEFGPTAVLANTRVADPLVQPDYSKVFVTRGAVGGAGIDRIIQTDVGLEEVLAGLKGDDLRLRDAVLEVVGRA